MAQFEATDEYSEGEVVTLVTAYRCGCTLVDTSSLFTPSNRTVVESRLHAEPVS